ncbi:acetyl-CoA carboxylase biotin carboxyl carrier protein subunit [uncultured Cohaesibacter sp.]|uniref:acetyl-CoA carboxylase biotin carboxyl carrier protein subunit n=1 Tax=uncultured Cohaesibacter sp. TaxID=1002546 RepID=UPI00292D4A86|nr:acetyl-CoA carboxylase biotin carboxyl carrier protein subunit [uncultured Cohaesibacter sp.]
MKRLRITVQGISYDVTVEDEDVDTAAPAPAAAAPAPAAPAPVAPAPVAAAPVAAPAPAAPAGDGAVPSPLAGTVVSVDVSVGQKVSTGDTLVVLEAMKMNTNISAPSDGTVTAVNVNPGATVTEGQVLVTLS